MKSHGIQHQLAQESLRSDTTVEHMKCDAAFLKFEVWFLVEMPRGICAAF